MRGTDAPSSFRKGMFGEQVYENFHLSFFPFFLPCFGKQLKKKKKKRQMDFFSRLQRNLIKIFYGVYFYRIRMKISVGGPRKEKDLDLQGQEWE